MTGPSTNGQVKPQKTNVGRSFIKTPPSHPPFLSPSILTVPDPPGAALIQAPRPPRFCQYRKTRPASHRSVQSQSSGPPFQVHRHHSGPANTEPAER